MKKYLLLGAAALCLPNTVFAAAPANDEPGGHPRQTSSATGQDSTAAAETQAQPAQDDTTTKPAQTGGIAEIVVTAQRRAESAQRSALSIQAISSEQLVKAGVSRPEDLSKIAAGVNIGTGGNIPQVYIRGIGTYATNNYADSPIAMNVDGVFVSRAWAMRGAYFDLQRVEVLRGPQGTLYGRNASGGAVNLITNRPTFDGFSGYLEGEAGNYNLLGLTGALNIPISDTLAMRVAGQKISRDGYLTDGYDDQKSESARVHLLYRPSAAISLLVTGTYQHTGGQGAGVVPGPQTPIIKAGGDPWMGSADPRVIAITDANPAKLQVAPGVYVDSPVAGSRLLHNDRSGFLQTDVWAISAELNWDLGPATLTFIPSYRYGKQSNRFLIMGYGVDEWEQNKQTTMELRLSHQTEKLKWVLGGYYFNEDDGNQPGKEMRVTGGEISSEEVVSLRQNARSYAAFGQATYSVLPNFRLTGGLRYTYERKHQSGETIGYSTYLTPSATVAPGTCPTGLSQLDFTPNVFATNTNCYIRFPLRGRISSNSVTWKTGFEYDLALRSLLYGNISTGFKSGGLYSAPSSATFTPTYKPEKLTAFELGVKNRFFDNKLQFNVEAFFYRYRDHQENHLSEFPGVGYDGFKTENAGRAHSYGVQTDILFQPTPADKLGFNVQWNRSKYDTFKYEYPSAAGGTPTVGCKVSAVNAAGNYTIDCSGFQLVRTPIWSGSADYTHTFTLASGATVDAGVSMRFASSSYLSIDFLEDAKNPAYATEDANLTYTAPDKKFSISAWIRNIGDKAVYTQAFRHPFVLAYPANQLAGPSGLIGMSVSAPRTYGLRASVSF